MPSENPIQARCPHCHCGFDVAASLTSDAGPKSGDFSLCARCGEWAIFDPDSPGDLRAPTVDEYIVIGQSETMRKARAAWVAVKEEDAKKKKAAPPPQKKPTPINDGFDDLMKDIYKSVTNVPDAVRREFRRHFFCGAVIAIQHLSRAIDSDGRVDVAELLRRYDDVLDEGKQFKSDIAARKA